MYDITKFIANHPGGSDKIVLAAGKSVEPFWSIYRYCPLCTYVSMTNPKSRTRQHYNSKLPFDLLGPMRIGTLHPDDVTLQAAQNKYTIHYLLLLCKIS